VYTAAFIISNIVFLSVFRKGLSGYFYSYIISYFCSCVFMLISSRLYFINICFKVDKGLFLSMLKYSIPYIPAAISWWINSSADKYMLIWIVGTGANGVYSVAQKIPTIITAITGIFTQAWQLSALNSYNDDDFSVFFSEIFRLLSSVLLFGICAVFVFNKPIASLLFKNEFYEGWKYVPMLTVAAGFSTMAGFLASAFTTSKKTNILFISTIIAAFVNIAVNYILMINIGTMGAAIATAFSFFVMVVVRMVTMKNIVVIKTNFIKLIISVLVVFSTSILLTYTENYYPVAVFVSLFIVLLNFKDFIVVIKTIISKFIRG